MKGQNEYGRLNELKIETRRITRLLSKLRRIHASKWMKRVRLNLQTLLNSPGTLPAGVQWGCLLAKLQEALGAVDEAMKISRSEKLAQARECIAGVLNRFSGGTIDSNGNRL